MPVYVYQAVDLEESCGKCKQGFEFAQPMKDEPLKNCPECRAPVMRIIQAPGVNTRWGKSKMSKDNLAKHGFKTGGQLLEEGKI